MKDEESAELQHATTKLMTDEASAYKMLTRLDNMPQMSMAAGDE